MSKRAIERRLASIEEQTATGKPRAEFNFTLVIPRDRAEHEGREILGPCEDSVGDTVHVAVDPGEYPNLVAGND